LRCNSSQVGTQRVAPLPHGPILASCGCRLDREEKAARNIWELALSTVGHTDASVGEAGNAAGDWSATVAGERLFPQDESLKEEFASATSAEYQCIEAALLIFSKVSSEQVRLIKPVRTLPGPTSMTFSMPSSGSRREISRQRT